MVRQQLYKNDYVGQKIPIEPIIECAANLTTDDDEMPLAASQGVVLDEQKLNRHFPDGQENQFLALDENLNAVPTSLLDLFVDLQTDQTIDGYKTFRKVIEAPGILCGPNVNNELMLSYNDGYGGLLTVMKNGEPKGLLDVKVKTFNDPYDPENEDATSKDAQIKKNTEDISTLEVKVDSKSQVDGFEDPFTGNIKKIRAISIDGTPWNIESVSGSKNRIEGGTDLKALKIGSENWNVAAYEPDEHYFEGMPMAKSLMYGNQIWNLPGAQAVQLYPTQPGTPKFITGLLQSSQKIGNIVILHVYFTIPAGKAGQEVILNGLPEPYEVDFHTGTPECYLVVTGTDLMVIIPNASSTSRVFGMNIVYATR